MTRRVRSALAAGAAVLAVSLAGAPVAAGAVPLLAAAGSHDGYCTAADPNSVTVVVDFQDLGGGLVIRCAIGLSSGAKGYAALLATGMNPAGTVHDGPAFVCRLLGRPSPTEVIAIPGNDRYTEQCVNTPPPAAYWSHWWATDGGYWTYSQLGAMSSPVHFGGFEGWSFSHNATTSTNPAPRVAPVLPAPPSTHRSSTSPPPSTTTHPPTTRTSASPAPTSRTAPPPTTPNGGPSTQHSTPTHTTAIHTRPPNGTTSIPPSAAPNAPGEATSQGDPTVGAGAAQTSAATAAAVTDSTHRPATSTTATGLSSPVAGTSPSGGTRSAGASGPSGSPGPSGDSTADPTGPSSPSGDPASTSSGNGSTSSGAVTPGPGGTVSLAGDVPAPSAAAAPVPGSGGSGGWWKVIALVWVVLAGGAAFAVARVRGRNG
jgi:hypothetical protein